MISWFNHSKLTPIKGMINLKYFGYCFNIGTPENWKENAEA